MTNPNEALLPCPFCGGEAETENTYECGTYYGCNRCIVWMLGAVKWNTRTPASQDRSLLQQALDALKVAASAKLADGTYLDKDCKITMAITAIQTAIAQPVQPTDDGMCESCVNDKCTTGLKCVAYEHDNNPIAQPVQTAFNLDKVHPEWKIGPSLFKDWCSRWFGPDSDESYLAKAVLNLPTAIAQPVLPAADIYSCSFFCDLPGCIKIQRDLLRDQLCKKATP